MMKQSECCGCAGGKPVRAAGGRAKSAPRKASGAGGRGKAAPGLVASVPQVLHPSRVLEEAGWVGGVLVELRFSVAAGFVFRLVAGKGGQR